MKIFFKGYEIRIARHTRLAIRILLLILLYPAAAFSQENRDSLSHELPEVTVRQSGRNAMRTDNHGNVSVSMADIELAGRTFGESDIINSLKLLPGVEAGSDYGTGIIVNGAEPSQTQYLIDGAPVIFPYRFSGVFSTFNSSHFSQAQFSRQSDCHYEPHLGATVNMLSGIDYSAPLSGLVNVGITASSLSIRDAVDNKIFLSGSGRVSYIDQLYGRWLKSSTNAIKYNFSDVNLTGAIKLSQHDEVMVSGFHNADYIGYDDQHYGIKTQLHWTNSLLNVKWDHSGGRLDMTGQLYYSSFSNTLKFVVPQFKLRAPAGVRTMGLKILMSSPLGSSRVDWKCGVLATGYNITPQWAVMESITWGDGMQNIKTSERMTQHTGYIGGFGSMTWWGIPRRFNIVFDMAVGVVMSEIEQRDSYTSPVVSPKLSLQWLTSDGNITLAAGTSSQYLHRIGFSELGLSSDFWIGVSRKAPIERVATLSLSWLKRLPWSGLKVETAAYYSGLRNQSEYEGIVMNVIDSDYDPFDHLVISDGYNVGGSVAVSRDFGNFTGGVNYSYGTGRRHLSGSRASWHSRHASGNVLGANLMWHEGRHWTLSATFSYSSGRPYTPISSLYAIGGNIAMQYGPRNSARLPSYQRLDLSGTYHFTTQGRYRLRHLVNLSLLNAYGHRNVEMQYFVLNSDKGSYSLKRLYSLYRFIPSLSYTIEF